MDDVSGIADSSSKFASFLTVARNFKYHCLYQLDFYFPWNREQFDNLLEYFKTKSNSSEPDDTHSDKDYMEKIMEKKAKGTVL